MNRKVLLAGAIIVLPVVILLFVSLGKDPRTIRSPLIGHPAPPFALRTAGATQTVSLENFRGAPVVVNFWATWCVPCFEEHQFLVRQAKLRPDVKFVGIIYDDQEATIQRFLAQNGVAYPHLMDDNGKTAIAYGVYGVPESFFVNRRGVIVAKFEGPLTDDVFATNLQKALAE